VRVLTTTDEPSDIDLYLVGRVFDTDPHFDNGLLDALHRFATDTGLDQYIRQDAIKAAAASARRTVEPWLAAALDDSDHRIVASAAYALLYRDRDRFAARVAPLLDGWADMDSCGWEIAEARRLLAGEDD